MILCFRILKIASLKLLMTVLKSFGGRNIDSLLKELMYWPHRVFVAAQWLCSVLFAVHGLPVVGASPVAQHRL